MTRFENKLCPVCRSRFNDRADIVVCPICGTPHHRACYSINNKCALENLHETGWNWDGKLPDEEPEPPKQEPDATITAAVDPQPDSHHAEYPSGIPYEEEQRMFEDEFGSENPFQELFQSLNDKEIGEDGVSMHELVAYSATSVYHYGKAFNIFREKTNGKKRKVSFNFCSGFFAPLFQFYRRMNVFGIITLLLLIVPSLIIALLPQQTLQSNYMAIMTVFQIVRIGLMILLCVFGDYIYYRHCVKSIVKFRSQYDGDTRSDDYYMSLYENGKPTFAGCAIGCLAMIFGQVCVLALAGVI